MPVGNDAHAYPNRPLTHLVGFLGLFVCFFVFFVAQDENFDDDEDEVDHDGAVKKGSGSPYG